MIVCLKSSWTISGQKFQRPSSSSCPDGRGNSGLLCGRVQRPVGGLPPCQPNVLGTHYSLDTCSRHCFQAEPGARNRERWLQSEMAAAARVRGRLYRRAAAPPPGCANPAERQGSLRPHPPDLALPAHHGACAGSSPCRASHACRAPGDGHVQLEERGSGLQALGCPPTARGVLGSSADRRAALSHGVAAAFTGFSGHPGGKPITRWPCLVGAADSQQCTFLCLHFPSCPARNALFSSAHDT